jgi:hypothetical protein
MNKLLSFINSQCPQSLYKSIIDDIEKIEQRFKYLEYNKIKNLKYKERFELLVNQLQSPSKNTNVYKLQNEIKTLLDYFRNHNSKNLNELEAEIKNVCIKIGKFMTNFQIREKREELIQLKNRELELVETLIQLIDVEVNKNSQNTDPLSKKRLQDDVKDVDKILKELKQEDDSDLFSNVKNIIENIDFDNNDTNVNDNIKDIKKRLTQINKYQEQKEKVIDQGQVSKKKTTQEDVIETLSSKIKKNRENGSSSKKQKTNSKQPTLPSIKKSQPTLPSSKKSQPTLPSIKKSQPTLPSSKKSQPTTDISQDTKKQLKDISTDKKIFENQNKYDNKIKEEQKKLFSDLKDVENKDKKVRIKSILQRKSRDLQNEIEHEKTINELMDKTPYDSKGKVKLTNDLDKVLKEASKEFQKSQK